MTIPIPSDFKKARKRPRKYLGNKKKNPWSNEQFDEVDWEHLDLVLKNKPDMYKIWRSKQNSSFCGTRVQVGLYLGTTLQDKRCPNCDRRETADHLILCSNDYAQMRIGPNYLPRTQTSWESG
jgi:hypothetical protein